MTRNTLVRILEAFFRRWYIYVIPLFALVALGVMSARGSSDFTSQGTLLVERGSLVTDRTGIGNQGYSYLTPAQFASQELNGLLLTDVFMESVLEDAGIELAADPSLRGEQTALARGSISTIPTSENLLLVRVTTDDPTTSQSLAQGTINSLISFKIGLDTADSTAAGMFFSELLEKYENDVTDARAASDAYLEAISAQSIDQLTPGQKSEFDRLSAEEALAAERYDSALEDLEASRLAALQSETSVRQSNTVVDPPQSPLDPNDKSLVDLVVTVAMFGVVGLVLTLIGPTVAALLDRSVLLPEDLDQVGEGGVIAVVPSVSRKDLRPSEGRVPTQGEVGSSTVPEAPGDPWQNRRAGQEEQTGPEATRALGEAGGDEVDRTEDKAGATSGKARVGGDRAPAGTQGGRARAS